MVEYTAEELCEAIEESVKEFSLTKRSPIAALLAALKEAEAQEKTGDDDNGDDDDSDDDGDDE
jgi:hypothetical protein